MESGSNPLIAEAEWMEIAERKRDALKRLIAERTS